MTKHKITGVVNNILPNGKFNVVTNINNQEHNIEAMISGKIRQFKIKIVRGDEVIMEIDEQSIHPNEKLRGTIIRRNKK